MADQPRRLCVIASHWLRSDEFIAALRASLCPQEPVMIIMDRRRGGSLNKSGLEDRRHQPLVDLALATEGFAIVPAIVDPNESKTQVSLLLPEVPVQPFFPMDDEDRERLERIRRFKRRPSARRVLKLGNTFREGLRIVQHFTELRHALPMLTRLFAVLIGVTLATFVLSPAGQNLGTTLLGRMFRGSPPLTSGHETAALPATRLSMSQRPARIDEASTVAHVPVITEKSTIAVTEPPRTEISGGPASKKEAPLGGADRLSSTPRETSPSKEIGTSRESGTSTRDTGTPPEMATVEKGGGRSTLTAPVQPSPSVPSEPKLVASRPSEAPTSKARPSRLVGSPRAELAREPVLLAWGKSYAVRLWSPAGRPMAGAEVWLVARLTDGTVQKIPMGALAELGTYRATLPTRSSTPIGLRVRVNMGNKYVDVPVKS